MTTGEKIKSLRKKFGLTQSELGEKLGIKKNAVSKWECGRVDDIPGSKIKAMSVLFGVPTSYLIDEDKNIETPAPETRDERTTLLMGLIEGLSDAEKDMIIAQLKVLRANRQTD